MPTVKGTLHSASMATILFILGKLSLKLINFCWYFDNYCYVLIRNGIGNVLYHMM